MVIQRCKVLVKADCGWVDNVVAGRVLLAVCPEEIPHRKMVGLKLFWQIRIKLIGQPVCRSKQSRNTELLCCHTL